jgi:23S rRNA pseudouridine955/2504/2580 synthase
MFLHAHRIAFVHPLTGAEVMIEAPLPPELAAFLARLGATRAVEHDAAAR